MQFEINFKSRCTSNKMKNVLNKLSSENTIYISVLKTFHLCRQKTRGFHIYIKISEKIPKKLVTRTVLQEGM